MCFGESHHENLIVPPFLEEAVMSNYNRTFELSIKEIDLIEGSIRSQISQFSRSSATEPQSEATDNHKRIIELMHVMGTLHNQKIWYGQVHHTGVPLG
jgi:hypothetical protein